MVGLIPRVLCGLVAQAGGEPSVVKVKQLAGVPPYFVFRMNEPVPDEQWQHRSRENPRSPRSQSDMTTLEAEQGL